MYTVRRDTFAAAAISLIVGLLPSRIKCMAASTIAARVRFRLFVPLTARLFPGIVAGIKTKLHRYAIISSEAKTPEWREFRAIPTVCEVVGEGARP
jgi:hypothetical protein